MTVFKRNSILAGLIAIVVGLGFSSSALADAHGNASCLGFEASGVAPPGSSDEFPGGVAELQTFLRDNFAHPTGAIVSEAAKLHLGSHEACDAAG
jgi:hypothetical protein